MTVRMHPAHDAVSVEGRWKFAADWDDGNRRLGAHRGPWSVIVATPRGGPSAAIVSYDDDENPRWHRRIPVGVA